MRIRALRAAPRSSGTGDDEPLTRHVSRLSDLRPKNEQIEVLLNGEQQQHPADPTQDSFRDVALPKDFIYFWFSNHRECHSAPRHKVSGEFDVPSLRHSAQHPRPGRRHRPRYPARPDVQPQRRRVTNSRTSQQGFISTRNRRRDRAGVRSQPARCRKRSTAVPPGSAEA